MQHRLRRAALIIWLAGACHAVCAAPDPEAAPSPGPAALRRIVPATVARLAPVASLRFAHVGGYVGRLAVRQGMLYVQSPFPHEVYAISVAPDRLAVKWRFVPAADRRANGLDCCGASAGGPVAADGRVYLNTFDGMCIALDAGTGQVDWQTRLASPEAGETLEAPPLVAAGRVFVGSGGDDYGARGWIAALDAASGAVLWKHYNTGPDADVGIGTDFRSARPGADAGVASWPPGGWRHGGGGLAGGMVYDAARNLLIHGTGHPAPWNPAQRPGDNRWTSGVFARDAGTGAARWFLPVNVPDSYGLGAGGAMLVADMDWHGAARSLLLHPDANGRLYVVDRVSGTLLEAPEFLHGNADLGLGPAGTPLRNPVKAVRSDATTRNVCPGWPGATGGGSAALGSAAFASPSGLLYIPVNRLCMDMQAREATYLRGTPFIGMLLRMVAQPGQDRGAVVAWDLARAAPAWVAPERFPVVGNVLATAGGLVLYGTLDGKLRARDAASGKLLWSYELGAGVVAAPLMFTLPGGGEYLAVLASAGGPAASVGRPGLDLRDATAARGYANALRDLPSFAAGGFLTIFALQ